MAFSKRFTFLIVGVSGAFFLVIVLLAGRVNAEPVIFFECSNPESPAVSDRSDLIRSCCEGDIIQNPMRLQNLMLAMEKVQKALRAVTVSRSGDLSGPDALTAKLKCYSDSIRFITSASKKFPPKKNTEKSDQFYAMFDELNGYVSRMSGIVRTRKDEPGAREDMTMAYTRFTGTCRSCHANFR